MISDDKKSKANILLSDYLYFPNRLSSLDCYKSFAEIVVLVDDIMLLEEFLFSSRFLKEKIDILDKIKIYCEVLNNFKKRHDLKSILDSAENNFKTYLKLKNAEGKILSNLIIDYCKYMLKNISNSKDFICS